MKFLLFFVSIIFSIIFYIFQSLSKGKDIFWNKISNTYELASFSWNLLIESFVFVLIAIIFLYFFSNLKENGTKKLQSYKTEIFYFAFYTILVFYIYFFSKNINTSQIIIIILFIIWDSTFNHISNIHALIKQKSNLRYFWLIINYVVTGLTIFYIYSKWAAFIPLIIIIFNIFFNFLIHKKYTNYVSLFISILSALFLIFYLWFSLFEIYILYI